ncbi:hypothetical protein [Mycolicibacterium pyrenivorans]|uniref:hypothetical protein n=1 Tax=Mycolicibacterium pyrenivorans TaxID=187102 RepID=UPI0021F28B26|nr:hypothetical protein [Mycolicibacterium pyrenivorans]MCV7152075.1 hypothetical protein [Mycolicibacterium pyrenivorans]
MIAINPVAPSLSLPAVQDRAVELSAWVDPIATWGDTISTTVENVGIRGSELATSSLPSLWQIVTNQSIYDDVAAIITNPVPGLQQFFTKLPGYTEIIGSGFQEAQAGLQVHFGKLPETFSAAWDLVLQGKFTQAFAEVTSWLVFGLGEAGWPLFPAFEIPGEIARDLGAPNVAKVLDVLFVGDNAATGYAYSLLSPPLTAIYQLTDILNAVSGSLYEGDWVTAVSEVINAPAKVLNAFLNGYQPSVAAEWETFPGLFSEDGPIATLFVKLPKAIAEALSAPPEEAADESATTTEATLAKVTSTEVASDGALVTLNVDAETTTDDTAAATDTSAEGSTEPAAEGDSVTAVVVDDSITEEQTPATEADDAATDDTETEEQTPATEADQTEATDEDSAEDNADSPDTETDAGSDTPDTASDTSDSKSGKSDSTKSGSDE